jgi:hypothetical protein
VWGKRRYTLASKKEEKETRHNTALVSIQVGEISTTEKTTTITTMLKGELSIPDSNKDTKGIVLFAHGSGSGRHSPRNQYVAQILNNDGLVILLVDLLTSEEEEADIRTQKISCKVPGLVLNKFLNI